MSADPSNRPITGDRLDRPSQKLFPPFHWVTTMDIYKEPSTILGRPSWANADDEREGENWGRLTDFAWDKLSCYGQITSPNVVIAMLAVLSGISVSPISTTAIELVGSHMATCWAIDETRESICIAYPVEPILAIAALQKLRLYQSEQKRSYTYWIL